MGYPRHLFLVSVSPKPLVRPAEDRSIYLPNPIYHQLAFGCILLFCITRNVLFVRRLSASHPRHSAKAVRTLVSGIATFAGGFLIWNVDNFFCKELRQGQNALGPLGFLLQGEPRLLKGGRADHTGHGYWHLMTGYGAFLIMTASTCRWSESSALALSLDSSAKLGRPATCHENLARSL